MKFYIYDYKNQLRTNQIVRTGDLNHQNPNVYSIRIYGTKTQLEQNPDQLIKAALRRISEQFVDTTYIIPEVEIQITGGLKSYAEIFVRTYEH